MSGFKGKMHKIRFPLRLRPRLRWGSLQRSPYPYLYLRGLHLREGLRKRDGNGMRWEEEREVRGGEERQGKGSRPIPKYFGIEPPQLAIMASPSVVVTEQFVVEPIYVDKSLD